MENDLSKISSTLEDMAATKQKEAKTNRIFKIGLLAVFSISPLFLAGSYLVNKYTQPAETDSIALISVKGPIGDGGVDAYAFGDLIKIAAENEKTKGIVLDMNSPGGSPVQAQIMYDRILKIKAEFKKPVYAVVGDLCASACYYAAAATDKIVVKRSSNIGSIGVIMQGWDFTEVMDKVGVKARIITSGKNKALMSPYQELSDENRDFLENEILAETHKTFIEDVKTQRPALRSREIDSDIFSGLIWNGSKAVKNGLADELGDLYSVQETYFKDANYLSYDHKPFNLLNYLGIQTPKIELKIGNIN